MKNMTEGSITKHLLSYAIPLILGNLLQLTYNAVDSILISKALGEEALAAVSASNPVMTIVILGMSGISIGAGVLMSQFYGACEYEKVKKELATTILFGGISSILIFVIGLLLSRSILNLMNVPTEILGMAECYLKIIFIGFLFTYQYNIMSAALRSVGDARTPVVFLGFSSVLNGCLDAFFLFEMHWGVSGAALATVIAEAVSAVLCFIYVYNRIPMLKISRAEFYIDTNLLKKTIKIGSITALQQSSQPIGKLLIQGIINAQGVTAIAAFNAVCRVDDFACIPAQSISHGMMTCVAQNFGAGKTERVDTTLRKGVRLELYYFPIICLFTLLLKTPIMRLFASADSADMVAAGVYYLRIKAFFFIMPGITNGIQGYFRGIGRVKVTLIATLIQISIRVCFVGILVPKIGICGEAYACFFGWLIMIFYEYGYYYKLRKMDLLL